MTTNSEQLKAASEAVDLANQLLLAGSVDELTQKGDRDYATETDYAIEKAVKEQLEEVQPTIGFLGEEFETKEPDQGLWWCLDPIDGTVNFFHGNPLCGISLALMDGGTPIMGIIDLPYFGLRYEAVRGNGATRNGVTIEVPETADLNKSVVALGDYAVGEKAAERNERRLELTSELASKALRVRMFGSAAVDLAWLADGKVAAAIALSNNSWDVSAGVLIAQEAGAVVYDVDGSEHGRSSEATLASSPLLKETILDLF